MNIVAKMWSRNEKVEGQPPTLAYSIAKKQEEPAKPK